MFIASGKVDHAMNTCMVWTRFSRLESLINFKDLLADVLKQEKPELPVDYQLIYAWILFSHLACDSIKLRDRKDLLADVLKQEKPELSVGSRLCLSMNRCNCKNTFQSFEKPVTINFTDKGNYWLMS